MNAFLLTIGALLTAVLVALFAIPPFIDWNTYRGVFEVEASRIIGRDVRVSGDVALRLLPQPYVSFEDIVIANPPGVLGEPFVRAKTFTMRLSVPPLLSGAIEAREMVLEAPQVRLRLDENGRGNWQDVGRGGAGGVSADRIALKSVAVTDGAISLENAGGERLAEIGNVTGDFAADALSGPFRFDGSANVGGERRVIQLSSGAVTADGKMDVKVSAKRSGSQGGLTVDGALATGRDAPPEFAGRMMLKLPGLPGFSRGSTETALPVEVEGDLTVNPERVAITGLSALFDQDRRAQELRGDAEIALTGNSAGTMRLTSRWLDLDRAMGAGGQPRSAEAIGVRLVEALGALKGIGTRNLKLALNVEQATVGGSEISGLTLNADVRASTVVIQRLGMRAPGGSFINVDGTGLLTDEGRLRLFRGAMLAEGGNSVRFLKWAAPALQLAERIAPRPFKARVRLNREGNLATFDATSITLGDARMRATYSVSRGASPAATLDISGPALDLAAIAPGLLTPTRLAAASRYDTAKSGDLTLKLRTDRLRDGARVYRDVDVHLARIGKVLNLRKLALADPQGFALSLTGTIADVVAGGRASLDGRATADSETAGRALLKKVAELTGRDLSDVLPLVRAPADVAFQIEERPNGRERFRVVVDGKVSGDTLRVDVASSAPMAEWRKGTARITVDLTGAQTDRTLAWLRGVGGVGPSGLDQGGEPQPMTATLRATGPVAEGLKTVARMNSGGDNRAAFEGSLALQAGGGVAFDGRVDFTGRDARVLAGRLGLATPSFLAGRQATASARVKGTDKMFDLALEDVQIGTATVAGALKVAQAGAGDRRTISGTLQANDIDFNEAQQLVLTDAPPSAEAGQDLRWSPRRFSLAGLGGVDLSLALTVDRLRFGALAALDTARLRLASTNGELTVALLGGTGPFSGALSGKLALKPAAVGAALSATLQGRRFAFDAVGGAGAKGFGDFDLTLEGRGLSPQALIGLMEGKGSVRFSGASLAALDPAAILTAAEALPDEADIDSDAFNTSLRTALQSLVLPLGTRRLGLTVKDGILNVARLEHDAAGGKVGNSTTLDLGRLQFESLWTLQPAAKGEEKLLPPVIARYTGALESVATVMPVYRTDELIRELIVRRLEGNVAELERLRQADQGEGAAERSESEQRELEQRLLQQRELIRRLPQVEERTRDQSFRLPGREPAIRGFARRTRIPRTTPRTAQRPRQYRSFSRLGGARPNGRPAVRNGTAQVPRRAVTDDWRTRAFATD